MEKLIQWLMKIEHMANEIYSRAAIYFENEPDLNTFLNDSAADEVAHYHAMASAAEHYRTRPNPPQSIAVDNETINKIENIFTRISEQIDERSLSRETIQKHIVNAEFSEWNDIFLYAISYLKEEMGEFKSTASRMQNHLRHVEIFLEKTEYGRKLLHKLEEIPPVWTENILIVDDEQMVSELIRAVLYRDGRIDIAANGEEGIRKLQEKYYKLVVSDVDMPIMDGLSFYRKAVEMFPTLQKRFMFITGDPSPAKLSFFEQHQLTFMTKPVPISAIRKEALKLLLA